MTWDDAMARATDGDLGNARPYSIRDAYEEGDVVHHPVFDIGFVIELLPEARIPSASQSSLMTTPGVCVGTMAYAYRLSPSSSLWRISPPWPGL